MADERLSTTVRDVEAEKFITAYAAHMKRSNKVTPPEWQDMVKTTKAIKSIKALCHSRLNNIDQLSSQNIINTIFSRYKSSIIDEVKDINLPNLQKIMYNLDHLKHMKKILKCQVLKLDFTKIKL